MASLQRKRWHSLYNDSACRVEITRHALHRFRLRAGVPDESSEGAILMKAIVEAVDRGSLFPCRPGLHAVFIRDLKGPAVVALCAVSWPPEKPYALAVITVLTLEMALCSFSHLVRTAHEEPLTRVRAVAA